MSHEIIWTGQRLRDARGRKRRPDGKPWSRQDLADAIGASRRSVDSWERDGVTPQAHHIVKLNDLFGASQRDDDNAGPRIKEATVPELLAELQLRFAHLARVARQAQPKGPAQ